MLSTKRSVARVLVLALPSILLACGSDDSASIGPPSGDDGGDASVTPPTPDASGGNDATLGDDGGSEAASGDDGATDGAPGDDGGSDSATADASDGATGPTTLDGGACDGGAPTVTSVDPKFGWTGAVTSLEIHGSDFVATPTAYLRSSTGTIYTLSHVAFVSSTSVVAQIDPTALGLAAGTYDVAVVDPDTCAGFALGAFKLVATPAPSNVDVSPAAGTTQADTPVTITGCDFPTSAANLGVATIDATGATKTQSFTSASLACVASNACPGGQSCTVNATIASSTMNAGLYLVRVSNTANATYGDFAPFVITDPSGKLGAGGVGWAAASTALNVPRRALGVTSGRIDSANRFLYAVGGEDKTGAALDSVEVAPLDEFGRVGAWTLERNHLTAKRSGVSLVRQGMYLYAIGGTSSNGGTGGASPSGTPIASLERARILDFTTAPAITQATSDTSSGNLAAGTWYYKVAAVLNASDADNPNGETLPSDEAIAMLGASGHVALAWSAVTNADHYVVYRSASANGTAQSEVLIKGSVSGTTYTDSGDTAQTQTPMPVGATGVWTSVLAAPSTPLTMLHARLDAAAAVGPDGAGGFRIYVSGGWGNCAAVGSDGLMACTESVAIDATGATVTAPFTPGASLGTARMRHAMNVVTAANGPSTNDDAGTGAGVLIVGGGAGGTPASTPAVEYVALPDSATAVTWTTANASFPSRDGLQMATVNGWSYAFMGGKPAIYDGTSDLAKVTVLTGSSITFGSWSSTSQTLPGGATLGRFGLAVESAYFYAIGGTSNDSDALGTVYQIVY